jgi:hypothetical protein
LYAPATHCEAACAGCPNEVSCLATVQNPRYYTGYFVGGSEYSHRNGRPCGNEGTWGWDYSGHWFHRLVRLDFCYPSKFQSGAGRYEPDGPRVCESLHDK